MEEIFANNYTSNKANGAILTIRQKREIELARNRRIFVSIIALLVFAFVAFAFVQSVKANTEANKKVKTFSSVEVKPGETVWSIANEYMSDEYESVADLVKEIEKTNHISASNIQAGNYIIIPYYTAHE